MMTSSHSAFIGAATSRNDLNCCIVYCASPQKPFLRFRWSKTFYIFREARLNNIYECDVMVSLHRKSKLWKRDGIRRFSKTNTPNTFPIQLPTITITINATTSFRCGCWPEVTHCCFVRKMDTVNMLRSYLCRLRVDVTSVLVLHTYLYVEESTE